MRDARPWHAFVPCPKFCTFSILSVIINRAKYYLLALFVHFPAAKLLPVMVRPIELVDRAIGKNSNLLECSRLPEPDLPRAISLCFASCRASLKNITIHAQSDTITMIYNRRRIHLGRRRMGMGADGDGEECDHVCMVDQSQSQSPSQVHHITLAQSSMLGASPSPNHSATSGSGAFARCRTIQGCLRTSVRAKRFSGSYCKSCGGPEPSD